MEASHAIQQTMFQRMVMVGAGPIFQDTNTKAARVQEPRQTCGREMPEVMRQGEVIPVLSEMARLIASEIWQCDQDQAAGAKDAASLLQLGARIGEVLERIPERNDIESRRRQSGRSERNLRNPVRAHCARRLAIRERHGLDAISIPAAGVQGAQEKSQSASDVEDSA